MKNKLLAIISGIILGAAVITSCSTEVAEDDPVVSSIVETINENETSYSVATKGTLEQNGELVQESSLELNKQYNKNGLLLQYEAVKEDVVDGKATTGNFIYSAAFNQVYAESNGEKTFVEAPLDNDVHNYASLVSSLKNNIKYFKLDGLLESENQDELKGKDVTLISKTVTKNMWNEMIKNEMKSSYDSKSKYEIMIRIVDEKITQCTIKEKGSGRLATLDTNFSNFGKEFNITFPNNKK